MVLRSFEKSTNANTILAIGMVFQYDTIRLPSFASRIGQNPTQEEIETSIKIPHKDTNLSLTIKVECCFLDNHCTVHNIQMLFKYDHKIIIEY